MYVCNLLFIILLIYQFTPTLHLSAHARTDAQTPACAFKHAQTLSVWGLETMELLSGFHLQLNREATNTMRS